MRSQAFIRIPWDSQAGCNATYAYVSFATEHDAKQALKCDGQVFQVSAKKKCSADVEHL